MNMEGVPITTNGILTDKSASILASERQDTGALFYLLDILNILHYTI